MTNMNIYDMTDTWSSSETTYAAIKMNVTDSGSAADSHILQLQLGSTDKLVLTKTGNIGIGTSTPITPLHVAGAGTITTSLNLGIQSTTQGSLVLNNTSANPTTVKSSNSASSAWTFTLPVSAGINGYLLSTNGSGVTSWTAPVPATGTIGYSIDGGGAVVATGIAGTGIRVPYSGTISEVTVLSDVSGNVKIDILKGTYSTYNFSSGSICGSSLPTLTLSNKYNDTTLSGWTTSFTDGDVFRFKVDGTVTPASITTITIILKVTKQ